MAFKSWTGGLLGLGQPHITLMVKNLSCEKYRGKSKVGKEGWMKYGNDGEEKKSGTGCFTMSWKGR
jgi:hypothetical protein